MFSPHPHYTSDISNKKDLFLKTKITNKQKSMGYFYQPFKCQEIAQSKVKVTLCQRTPRLITHFSISPTCGFARENFPCRKFSLIRYICQNAAYSCIKEAK